MKLVNVVRTAVLYLNIKINVAIRVLLFNADAFITLTLRYGWMRLT